MAGQQAIEDCPLCGHVLHVGVCGRAENPELGAIGFCDCGDVRLLRGRQHDLIEVDVDSLPKINVVPVDPSDIEVI